MLLKNESLESRTPRLWTVSVTVAALVLVAVVAAVSLVPRAVAEEKASLAAAAKPADEVSPASDQSATKEGSKAESKPAPVHRLVAEPNTDEAKAIAEIEKLGGEVTLDEKSPGKPVTIVKLVEVKVTDTMLDTPQETCPNSKF